MDEPVAGPTRPVAEDGTAVAEPTAQIAGTDAGIANGPAQTAQPDPTPVPRLITDFRRVYLQEYREIKDPNASSGPETRAPSTSDEMTGISLSGGGIRSASFCLGVLQALNAADLIQRFDYLSTVSGGGYIGTSLTVSMAHDGAFPFGKTGRDPGETLETGHLRDHSRYLLQDGLPSAISAVAIYLRGIAMNIVVVMPFLLFAAAALALVTDTRRLDGLPRLLSFLPEGIQKAGFSWSILALGTLFVLLVFYAICVSVFPIVKVEKRKTLARGAAYVLVLLLLPLVVEVHFALLRLMFGVHVEATRTASSSDSYFQNWTRIVAWLTPFVVAVLPFVRSLAEKALTTATKGLSDAASKWTSRVILVLLALVVPVLFWVVVLQLAYWAIGVSACPGDESGTCGLEAMDTWQHAPGFLTNILGYDKALPSQDVSRLAAYLYAAAGAVLLVVTWPLLNVNSNSLHQLYRDRLGRAFLFRRTRPEDALATGEELQGVDTVRFSDITAGRSPYHLINTALNVPGSRFANRRGRNADFFIFSRLFIGSAATGYVDTATAESVTDGLNIGTAMAISGAAAAPNMGMASMRPLSPTIAFFNVRLGRWLRHPADIIWLARWWRPIRWWLGRPGPFHLLKEAFFKSGTTVTDGTVDEQKCAGFIFLTDGGHIENLGIYELLRRRCRLIVAVDAEADPDMTSASLVQLQRFARIDLGTTISMDWQPIAQRSLQVSTNSSKKLRDTKSGPHVALGVIDYPPAAHGADRETGVLIYVKSSMSGDENDYVAAYKDGHPTFPHESTMEQLFSEEQFECYRALGEHIGRRMISGEDEVSVSGPRKQELLQIARTLFPDMRG
jgi:hypothetical protein